MEHPPPRGRPARDPVLRPVVGFGFRTHRYGGSPECDRPGDRMGGRKRCSDRAHHPRRSHCSNPRGSAPHARRLRHRRYRSPDGGRHRDGDACHLPARPGGRRHHSGASRRSPRRDRGDHARGIRSPSRMAARDACRPDTGVGDPARRIRERRGASAAAARTTRRLDYPDHRGNRRRAHGRHRGLRDDDPTRRQRTPRALDGGPDGIHAAGLRDRRVAARAPPRRGARALQVLPLPRRRIRAPGRALTAAGAGCRHPHRARRCRLGRSRRRGGDRPRDRQLLAPRRRPHPLHRSNRSDSGVPSWIRGPSTMSEPPHTIDPSGWGSPETGRVLGP